MVWFKGKRTKWHSRHKRESGNTYHTAACWRLCMLVDDCETDHNPPQADRCKRCVKLEEAE